MCLDASRCYGLFAHLHNTPACFFSPPLPLLFGGDVGGLIKVGPGCHLAGDGDICCCDLATSWCFAERPSALHF